MVKFKEAGLVKSLAGHDKNELYIIISVQGEHVYLPDGRKYPLNKQERRNRKHLQLIHEHDETLEKKLTEGAAVRDEEIAGFTRSRRQQEVKQNVKSRRDRN